MLYHVRIAVILLAALTSMALGEVQCEGDPTAPAGVRKTRPLFDSQRAFGDAEKMVALGPRPAGTEAAKLTQNYLIAQLESAGLVVRQDAFTAATPAGELPMKNIIGVLEGERPGVVIIGAHFDTKRIPGATFLGANDGAAGSAVVLELARTISAGEKPAYTMWFVLFDGEEAVEEWSDQDGIYGSRHLVSTLRAQGLLSNIRAMILLDLIGDRDLTVQKESTSYGKYRELFWESARELGYGDYFLPEFVTVSDDHTPFAEAGIRSVNLIDFMYGSRQVPGKYWHTPGDTLENISANSFQIVGEVVLATLPKIERLIHVVETRTGYMPLPAEAAPYLPEELATSAGEDAVGEVPGVSKPEEEEASPAAEEAPSGDTGSGEEEAPPAEEDVPPGEPKLKEEGAPATGETETPPADPRPDETAPPATEGAGL